MAIRRSLTRRALLAQSGALAAVAATPTFSQTSWPERAVRIIVPYPAGGSAAVLARLYAEQLQARFGQPFVIETGQVPAAIPALTLW